MAFMMAGNMAASPSESWKCSIIQFLARPRDQVRKKCGPRPSMVLKKESHRRKNFLQEKTPSSTGAGEPTGAQRGFPGSKSSLSPPFSGRVFLGPLAQTMDRGMTMPLVQEDIS